MAAIDRDVELNHAPKCVVIKDPAQFLKCSKGPLVSGSMVKRLASVIVGADVGVGS